MKLSRITLGALALATLGGIALAQVPTQFLSTLTGSEGVVVRVFGGINGTSPLQTSVTVAQIRDGSGYVVSTPVAAATVQAANNASILSLQPAGTLATLTVNLPLIPFDGQRVQIFSSQAITALTLTATGSGQSISAAGAVTALTAGQSIEYFYVASTGTWNRIQ